MRDFKQLFAEAMQEGRQLAEHRHVTSYDVLYAMLQELEEIRQLLGGSNVYRITPVTIGTTPTQILDINNQDNARRVVLWVDSAVNTGTSTIRVGGSSVNVSTNGVLVSAGQANELGKVDARTKLFAIADVAIQAYVLEYST